jgi:hypothetical protein
MRRGSEVRSRESKQESSQQKSSASQCSASHVRSNVTCSSIHGVMYYEFIAQGQTVHRRYCTVTLPHLRESKTRYSADWFLSKSLLFALCVHSWLKSEACRSTSSPLTFSAICLLSLPAVSVALGLMFSHCLGKIGRSNC